MRFRGTHPKCGEGICRDLKDTLVNPVKESPKGTLTTLPSVDVDNTKPTHTRAGLVAVVVENDSRYGRMLGEQFSQHSASGSGALLVLVAAAQLNKDLGPLVDNVVQGRRVEWLLWLLL